MIETYKMSGLLSSGFIRLLRIIRTLRVETSILTSAVQEKDNFLQKSFRLPCGVFSPSPFVLPSQHHRVHSYAALRNMYVLVQAVFYFVGVVIGTKAKLSLIFKRVCEKAKRFYEVATFFHYAVADGIHRLLFATRLAFRLSPSRREDVQRRLEFVRPPF